MGMAQSLNPTLRTFIERQPMFFVATADVGGRVNVSPKVMDTMRVLDDQTIRWLNSSGSRKETAYCLPEMTMAGNSCLTSRPSPEVAKSSILQ